MDDYKLEDLLPQPRNWFQRELDYSGWGRIEFENPKGRIEGHTTCHYDELGRSRVMISIEKWENEDYVQAEPFFEQDKVDLRWLLGGEEPTRTKDSIAFGYPAPPRKITSLIIKSDAGEYISTDAFIQFWGLVYENDSIPVYVQEAKFIVKLVSLEKPVYRVLPLINYFSAYTWSNHKWHFINHPLRLIRIPKITQNLVAENRHQEDENIYAVYRNIIHSYFVVWKNDYEEGFIELLSEYDSIKESLVRYSTKLTAIMVAGRVDKQSIDEGLDENFLWILSLASGNPINIAWIEYRDISGHLIYRQHRSERRYEFGSLRATISEGSIGYCLQQFYKSPYAINPKFIKSIQNLINAQNFYRPNPAENLYYVCAALDELGELFEVRTKISPPSNLLDVNVLAQLKVTLKKISNEIKKLKHQFPQTPPEILDEIAKRVIDLALNRQNEFAQRLIYLGEIEFGLQDFEILRKYYASQGQNISIWVNQVNNLRNQSAHQAYYDETIDMDNLRIIFGHLYDILTRIILKMIKYEGDYYPIFLEHNPRNVDWVKEDTNPEIMAYK